MTMKSIVNEIDKLLKLHRFHKMNKTWNRNFGYFIDSIELEISKSRDMFTLEIAVTDRDVYGIVWNRDIPRKVMAPSATVRSRIGHLIDGRERWWNIGDVSSYDEVIKILIEYGIPFLNQNHNRAALRDFISKKDVVKMRYPPPIFNLAIIEYMIGNKDKSHSILEKFYLQGVGSWRDHFDRVAKYVDWKSNIDV